MPTGMRDLFASDERGVITTTYGPTQGCPEFTIDDASAWDGATRVRVPPRKLVKKLNEVVQEYVGMALLHARAEMNIPPQKVQIELRVVGPNEGGD
jgi:hypothetical protein